MPTILIGDQQSELDVEDFPAGLDRGGNTGPVRVRAGQTLNVTQAEAQHLAQRGVQFNVQKEGLSTEAAKQEPRERVGTKEEVGVTEAGGISVANARLPGDHAHDQHPDNAQNQAAQRKPVDQQGQAAEQAAQQRSGQQGQPDQLGVQQQNVNVTRKNDESKR